MEYFKSEALEQEEMNEHLIENMVYIPPMRNGAWFIKDEFRQEINKYWKHNTMMYITGMYQGLP